MYINMYIYIYRADQVKRIMVLCFNLFGQIELCISVVV